jgi:hypothetical protein
VSLSILCVTQAEPYADRFIDDMAVLANTLNAEFVVLADRMPRGCWLEHHPGFDKLVHCESQGYLESVLEQGVAECGGDYILRLDDDERCSEEMATWLKLRKYEHAEHWKFNRLHLWNDERHCLRTPQLWPDVQTRLSIKSKSGGRTSIHTGSPFGGGDIAHVSIEHHKFLVKTFEERKAIAARYDAVQPGTGTGGMMAFNLPEIAYAGVLDTLVSER